MINTWFKFEGKTQKASKVIMFTRNHTDDDPDDERTKNNMSGGGHNFGILLSRSLNRKF